MMMIMGGDDDYLDEVLVISCVIILNYQCRFE